MRFQQLRYFVAAAEEGSLSKASRVLHIAQPALSQQIMNLERSLSVELFERTPTGVRATPAGDILLQRARSILRQVEQTRHDLLVAAEDVRGDVSLAMPIAVSDFATHKLLRSVRERYPQVHLQIEEGTSVQCQTLVENARVDLGLLPKGADSSKVHSLRSLTQGLFLVGALEHQPAGTGNIPFQEAAQYPLALLEKPHSLRLEIERIAAERMIPLSIIAESSSSRLVRHYVLSGIACSIMPWLSFHERYQAGQVFARRIVRPSIARTYVTAWPKARPLNRTTEAVKELMLEIMTELAESIPQMK